MRPRALTPLLIFLLATLLARGGESERYTTGRPVDFHDEIKPLFAVHCTKCHGAETQKSRLRLDLADAALRGGESGEPAIVPGHTQRAKWSGEFFPAIRMRS